MDQKRRRQAEAFGPQALLVATLSDFGFQWHTTDRCNLRCAHCYQEDFSAGREAGLEKLKSMADRIFGTLSGKSVSVNITGGEPLLRPGLFDLLDHLHSFGNLHEVNIITNGSVATDAVLGNIRRLEKIGSIKVSLEAGDEGKNDAIRGKGCFKRVVAGIERLVTTGKPVVLMATLGAYNAGEVGGIADLGRRVGAAGVIYERFVPLGTGKAIEGGALDRADWARAVRAITKAAGLDADPDDLLPYRAFWLWTDGREGCVLDGALCNLGDKSMALMPDGTVFPCRRLPIPVGNILQEPFDEILCRLRKYSVHAIRPHLRGGTCGLCGVDDCAGCRALARALCGDLLSDDPQCALCG